jgi:zinc protease
VVEAEREKAQAVLVVGFRGTDVFNPDRYALELIDEASSDLASRFFIRIREKMGLAYYVGASQIQTLSPGLFAFYLGTDPEKIESVKSAFLQEIRKLSSDGLTPIELARAKKKLIGQQQIQNQSNDIFAYMTALDELYGLGFNHSQELVAKVNAVTLSDIKRVTAKYFAKQPYVLAIVRPPAKPAGAKSK